MHFRARVIGGPAAPPRPPAEIPLDEFLQVDRAGVEIGARLIPLVDTRRGPSLIDRIGGLRRDLAKKNGLWVPPIRVREVLHMEGKEYRIFINGKNLDKIKPFIKPYILDCFLYKIE